MGENTASARPYVVLRSGDDGSWQELGAIVATGAEQACKRAAKQLDESELEQGVTLRAVSQRAWDASETRLRLERTSRLVMP